jgi:hypothetical protein
MTLVDGVGRWLTDQPIGEQSVLLLPVVQPVPISPGRVGMRADLLFVLLEQCAARDAVAGLPVVVSEALICFFVGDPCLRLGPGVEGWLQLAGAG